MRSTMMMSAAAAMLTEGAAGAATVTFTGLPDEGAQLTSWSEDGILATAQGGALVAHQPDAAHLDDSGTGVAASLAFSTGGLFAATSLDIIPSPSSTDLGEGEVDCGPYSFANVAVTGYADGSVVASDAFDLAAVNGTYAFAGLDLLVIGSASLPTDLPDGSFLPCSGPPCTHYSDDSVTLAPVPLPASEALFALGVAGLAAACRRRR